MHWLILCPRTHSAGTESEIIMRFHGSIAGKLFLSSSGREGERDSHMMSISTNLILCTMLHVLCTINVLRLWHLPQILTSMELFRLNNHYCNEPNAACISYTIIKNLKNQGERRKYVNYNY